jgi:hypothetical protein
VLKADAIIFVESELKALYPDWSVTPKAVTLWVSAIQPFAWDVVKRAVDQTYTEFSGRTPKLHNVLALCRIYSNAASATGKSEPVLVYKLVKQESKDRRAYYRPGRREPDPALVEKEAQRNRTAHEESYGGSWYVEWPSDG